MASDVEVRSRGGRYSAATLTALSVLTTYVLVIAGGSRSTVPSY